MRKGRGRLFEVPADGLGAPLNQRIAAHLRKLILEGAINPGARLPAQRILARDLRVSRNTVLSVLQQLTSEGLIETRAGSGTYVARETTPFGPQPKVERPAQLSASHNILPLEVGTPALDLFPLEAWNRVQTKRWRRMPRSALEEGDPAGWRGLRELIAVQLAAMRGLRCSADRVLIVPSAQAGVELIARTMAQPGEGAWIEDPGYFRARDAMRAARLNVMAVPIDAGGFNLQTAQARGLARLAYLTPASQFPTGFALTPQRRKGMLDWSRATEGWIIEDDYDSDFCFEGRAQRPLTAEPGADRVIYVGTFNNIMFPALRIAYVVAPEAAVDRLLDARRRSDRALNTPQQVVLQDFMEEGHLAAHVRNCRDVYGERREALIQAVNCLLGGVCEPRPAPLGLHLPLWINGERGDADIRCEAERRGVIVNAMSEHAVGPVRQGLFLGFAPHSVSQIRCAVERLAACFEDARVRV